MSQWFADARNIYDAVDADLIRSYQAGLILGILLITTLALFPGREPDWATKLSEDPKQTAQGDALKNPNNKTNQSPNAQPVKLHDNQNNSDDEYSTRTPHQNMNVVVYFLLLSLAAFILDRLYGGLISVWLRVYFPREASLLGFKPAK